MRDRLCAVVVVLTFAASLSATVCAQDACQADPNAVDYPGNCASPFDAPTLEAADGTSGTVVSLARSELRPSRRYTNFNQFGVLQKSKGLTSFFTFDVPALSGDAPTAVFLRLHERAVTGDDPLVTGWCPRGCYTIDASAVGFSGNAALQRRDIQRCNARFPESLDPNDPCDDMLNFMADTDFDAGLVCDVTTGVNTNTGRAFYDFPLDATRMPWGGQLQLRLLYAGETNVGVQLTDAQQATVLAHTDDGNKHKVRFEQAGALTAPDLEPALWFTC